MTTPLLLGEYMAYTDPKRTYQYSYSGSDATAFVYFEGRGDQLRKIESMHTISWSVFEEKGDARALGYKGVRGFTSGPRTVAGSLIMTVIEDNPLAGLMDILAILRGDPTLKWPGWSHDWEEIGVGTAFGNEYNRRLATTIPPFNVLIQYVTEGSTWNSPTDQINKIPGAATLIRGVTFLGEGQTTSTSDAVTEANYTWKAMDLKPLSKQQLDVALINPLLLVGEAEMKNQALQDKLLKKQGRL
jgi:hypothetical protein